MEQTIGQLTIRWNLLRIIAAGQAVATFLLILAGIPTRWWPVTGPIFVIGCIATILTAAQCKVAWAWLTEVLQGALFATGLFSMISGINDEAYVPLLLLAFLMAIASEHVLSVILKYSPQFSLRGNHTVVEFNAHALRASLGHVYGRLARDGVVFGVAFLLSIAVASLGAVGMTIPVLSDPSLYLILVSISLAFLFVFEEQ